MMLFKRLKKIRDMLFIDIQKIKTINELYSEYYNTCSELVYPPTLNIIGYAGSKIYAVF